MVRVRMKYIKGEVLPQAEYEAPDGSWVNEEDARQSGILSSPECSHCGHTPATVHVTDVTKGVTQHFCSDCAPT